MKVTKPPRETVSSLNYRDADETPTNTAPELKSLSATALSLLMRDAEVFEAADNPDEQTWSLSAQGKSGAQISICCTGPDLPKAIPEDTAHPSVIPFERPWQGKYRLIVRAPLVVLDLYWRPDEPLRIMGFSRGDWEDDLQELSG